MHADGREASGAEDTIALLALIAAYSLEDVDSIQGRRKGKETLGGQPTDEELALELFAEEARALERLAHDMVLAQSINQAICMDAALLAEHERAEEVARGDREIARAIAEGRTPPEPPAASITDPVALPASGEARTAALPAVEHLMSAAASSSHAPSSSGKKLPSGTKARLEACVICRDDIRGVIVRAPCGDAYDIECLVDLFRAATVDESLFPPACCRQPFQLSMVRQYLNKELASLVDKKSVEFGTRDRVYCCRPSCSTFIGSGTTVATPLACPECWKETCGHCKKEAHDVSVRCSSEEDAGVVALAEESGWKRCPGCGHIVELTIGCYHMTCRCRHQFCYLCAATWKTCRCEQWEENRLLHAAQDRVERQQRAQAALNPNVRPARAIDYGRVVAQEVARLRENHDCLHRWRYVSGGGRCEGCGHYLRLFLFNCNTCQIWACARCRRNRWL
ncbi:hypothetical protein K466DRAFT_662662 [Polyporus arcularius HHB13444]|uniref:RBR-type E3 ubiquitin transferase n=1 Tax=Polyporus arcularius HHB13444 TaxID=1314778 RepID=A0A5C3PED5_9APHY|nr:hypothetical protein K466DRAFT_662662 [Polyporus arcularius HHB13444]